MNQYPGRTMMRLQPVLGCWDYGYDSLNRGRIKSSLDGGEFQNIRGKGQKKSGEKDKKKWENG